MTPFEIGILLHYYTRVDDYAGLVDDAPAGPQTRDRFKSLGLLRDATTGDSRAFELTERGHAYVSALLAVKLPVAVWVMPDDPGTPLGEATSLYAREV